MKKIVLFCIGLLFLVSTVTAYQVYIDAPSTLSVGKPLVVTGTTSFGIGTPIDVVLYYQLTTTSEIERKIVYIQTDKTFTAVFDTTGLKTGLYKVEVPSSGMGGDSVTMRVIELIDRSDDIRISSSLAQPFSGSLYIAGTIDGGENAGIQVEVAGPGGDIIFGPRYVNTNYIGDFYVEVPVTEAGNYDVSFTDTKGYIGTKTFTVLDTQSIDPVSAANIMSARSASSAERPAFFIVKCIEGPFALSTSSSVDWVVEYAEDGGTVTTVDTQGEQNAERLDLTCSGKTLYIKIFPKDRAVSSDVILYGENVGSVKASPSTPAVFLQETTVIPPTTQETPLFSLTALSATLLVAIALRLTKKP